MNKMIRKIGAALLLACSLPGLLSAQTVGSASSDDDRIVTVAVLTVNDFHASFVKREGSGIPGAAALWQAVDSLKRAYPHHLILSAGDNFGGSFYYKATQGALMPVLLDDLGIRLSALGNHEFDDGQPSLVDRWSGNSLRPAGWDIRYLCANVREEATGRIPAFARPFTVERVALPGGREVSIAFVGLITGDTPLQASRSRLRGLAFDSRYDAVLDSVKRLPEFDAARSATARIVLTHIGSGMTPDGMPAWRDGNGAALEGLRDTTWDAFISSHTHEWVKGRVGRAGYPIVQAGCYGRGVGLVKLRVDTTQMRLVSVTTEVCPVNPGTPLGAPQRRLQAQIDSTLAATRTEGGAALQDYVTHFDRAQRHERGMAGQTEVGTLVCRAYAEAYRRAAGLRDRDIVVGVSHFGSIRTGFPAGDITVLEVGDALPFSNDLAVFHVDGSVLRRLVDFGFLRSEHGRMQTAWLDAEIGPDGSLGAIYYVSPAGRRIRIKDTTHCTIVVDDFITNGGDGYPRECFPADRRDRSVQLPPTTDAFIRYLQAL